MVGGDIYSFSKSLKMIKGVTGVYLDIYPKQLLIVFEARQTFIALSLIIDQIFYFGPSCFSGICINEENNFVGLND